MVEMACSMLPSQTSHPGMALWTQAGSCYLAVDPSVGQAREDSKEHFLVWMGLPSRQSCSELLFFCVLWLYGPGRVSAEVERL